MTQLFIFLFLLLFSFCDRAFFTHQAVRGRWGTPFSCASRRDQGMTDNIAEKKVKKQPVLASFFLLALRRVLQESWSHWPCCFAFSFSVPCASSALSRWGKKKPKMSWKKQVSWLKLGSMQPKLKDQTAQIHSWTSWTNPAVKPVLSHLSGRSCRGSFTKHFACPEEMKVTPTWNKECHEAK